VRGFKKCCLSSIMDGTDDYTLWNDCEDGQSTDGEDGVSDSDW
jgi:hypothetical protein